MNVSVDALNFFGNFSLQIQGPLASLLLFVLALISAQLLFAQSEIFLALKLGF